jgi:hypothetical protein
MTVDPGGKLWSKPVWCLVPVFQLYSGSKRLELSFDRAPAGEEAGEVKAGAKRSAF